MRFFPREKGKAAFFKEKPSTKAIFPLSCGKNRISQRVENRGSLISAPLAHQVAAKQKSGKSTRDRQSESPPVNVQSLAYVESHNRRFSATKEHTMLVGTREVRCAEEAAIVHALERLKGLQHRREWGKQSEVMQVALGSTSHRFLGVKAFLQHLSASRNVGFPRNSRDITPKSSAEKM